MKCRHCKATLSHIFIDLGSSPPSNSYLTSKTIKQAEKWYPLKVFACESCWLVQTEDFVGAEEMFSKDYAYYSSYSSSWLKHAENYMNSMIDRLKLDGKSNVIEVASNDGYLLQFTKKNNIPCFGIEPTQNTAEVAQQKGIEIIQDFFGVTLAKKLKAQSRQADLMIANNVLAHVPDINDFVKGFSILLNEDGVVTFEFPHILNLVEKKQFDTIYHEHYSYLSLLSVNSILEYNGLSIFDVNELNTHGGSLRVFAQRSDIRSHKVSDAVFKVHEREIKSKLNTIDFYTNFQKKSENIKFKLLSFLISAKAKNQTVIAYGAAAKGSTILNYSGIRSDLIPFVVDKNPNKSGKFMPGSRIPIIDECIIRKIKPKYIIILPWNLKSEIEDQLSYIREWDGNFVVAIPELMIF